MNEATRPAGADDVDMLAVLAAAARVEKEGVRGGDMFLAREAPAGPDEARFEAAVASDEWEVLVGVIDDSVIGYSTMRYERLRDGSLLARVEELFVLEGCRGVGVGEAMMDALVEAATRSGCRGIDALALPGDRATKNFFETFGLTARAIVVHRPL